MRQECGWFDKEEHSVGILSSYLSGDAASVQTVKQGIFFFFWLFVINKVFSQAFGFPLSMILQAFSTIIFGMIIALATSAKLAAVCLTSFLFMVPIVLLEARYQRMNIYCLMIFGQKPEIFYLRNTSNSEMAEKDAIAWGIKIAAEAISNIRTVASLSDLSSKQ